MTQTRKPVLLVAEDDETLRESLAEELEYNGFEVLQAANGRIAFELVQKHAVDGVVSDVRMPGGDGVELLQRLRERSAGTPVLLFITGYSDVGVVDAYDMGAEAVLKKPFSIDELISSIAWMLKPKAERWQSENIETKALPRVQKNLPSLHSASEAGDIVLGRGGVFLKGYTACARGASLCLDVQFVEKTPACIRGVGLVRWVRQEPAGDLPPGSGVEFRRVETSCVDGVLDFHERQQVTAYIPKG